MIKSNRLPSSSSRVQLSIDEHCLPSSVSGWSGMSPSGNAPIFCKHIPENKSAIRVSGKGTRQHASTAFICTTTCVTKYLLASSRVIKQVIIDIVLHVVVWLWKTVSNYLVFTSRMKRRHISYAHLCMQHWVGEYMGPLWTNCDAGRNRSIYNTQRCAENVHLA